jgi:hypothetical protein
MIPPALALALILADMQAQLAEARARADEDHATIEALCEGVCAARQAGISAATEVRHELCAILGAGLMKLAGREPEGSDICDYSDPASIAAASAALDALETLETPPCLPPGHPESLTADLDDDGAEDMFSEIVAILTGGAS